jgi:hypothetical protein
MPTPINAHAWEREEFEHYVEPEWCSKRLFEVEQFRGSILDPACGFGRVVKSAREANYWAVGGDIVDRGFYGTVIGDFFGYSDVQNIAENIVSNPPFDQFERFARHAIDLATNKVALIWLVRRLNAARWLEDTPLARIWLLTPRPSMPPGKTILEGRKPGGGRQDFCWLVWHRTHRGPPELKWLRRDP